MSIALVPRPAARRRPRANPITPAVSVGVASLVTVLLASAFATLLPRQAAAGSTSEVVVGPVHVLPTIHVIAGQ